MILLALLLAAPRALAYPDYAAEVARANLDLAAQKAGVSAAEAQIDVARIFPDPQLGVGYGPFGDQAGGIVSLSETVELGGKRGARISAAELDHRSARAAFDDFLRTLRGQAAQAFIDALATRLALDRQRRSLEALDQLVHISEERLRAGDVGQVVVMQSRIEAQRFRGDILQAESAVRAADLALAQLLAPAPGAAVEPVQPVGELRALARNFDAEALAAKAREERADVLSKKLAMEAAAAREDLAHANRWIDPSLSLSYANQPGSPTGFTAGISVPLPVSHVYNGEVRAAEATRVQAGAAYQAAALKAEVELRQALVRFGAAVQSVNLYTGGVLSDADKVLDATLYSYKRGAATILEFLEAQRAANDLHLSYVNALAEYNRSLVAVEVAAGTPELDF